MSNTYFKIQTEDYLEGGKYPDGGSVGLTAYMGGDKIVQLTVIRFGDQQGVAYVGLTKDQCAKLAGALLERSHGRITSTNEKKSNLEKYKD